MITVYADARCTHHAPRTCAAVYGRCWCVATLMLVVRSSMPPLRDEWCIAIRRIKGAKSAQFCPKVSIFYSQQWGHWPICRAARRTARRSVSSTMRPRLRMSRYQSEAATTIVHSGRKDLRRTARPTVKLDPPAAPRCCADAAWHLRSQANRRTRFRRQTASAVAIPAASSPIVPGSGTAETPADAGTTGAGNCDSSERSPTDRLLPEASPDTLVTTSSPPLTVVPPVKSLLPLRTSVPSPTFVRLMSPPADLLMLPENVVVDESPTTKRGKRPGAVDDAAGAGQRGNLLPRAVQIQRAAGGDAQRAC